jgi:pimeloyl-ACP methyl ester carboxylesterase
MLLLALLTLAADPEVRSEAVELKTDTGTLAGVLDLPPAPGPWPVVLIHPGSGPTDRDGNQPGMRNDSLKMLGRALAERGVACLRIDKRGVGGSAKALAKESDVRIETYAADAAAWVKFLRADRRFTKVGFVGHSEGSLIGLLAGQKEKLDAFVSLCGPGERLSDTIRRQVKGQLPKELAEKNEAILTALEAGKRVDDVPKELMVLYRPSVQPFLISVFQHDPATEVGKLGCPVLVVTGTHDIQISAADGEKLAAGAKGARHVAVKDMCHVLKETDKTGRLEQALTVYRDPKVPLHPKLAGELADFLTASLGAGK